MKDQSINVYQPPAGYFNAFGLRFAVDKAPSRLHIFFAELLLGWIWEPEIKEYSRIASLIKKDETQKA